MLLWVFWTIACNCMSLPFIIEPECPYVGQETIKNRFNLIMICIYSLRWTIIIQSSRYLKDMLGGNNMDVEIVNIKEDFNLFGRIIKGMNISKHQILAVFWLAWAVILNFPKSPHPEVYFRTGDSFRINLKTTNPTT